MIGYSLGDTTIGVTYIPPRIKPCLAIQKGNVLTKVASFNDQYSATIFLDQLADFVHAKRIAQRELIGLMMNHCLLGCELQEGGNGKRMQN